MYCDCISRVTNECTEKLKSQLVDNCIVDEAEIGDTMLCVSSNENNSTLGEYTATPFIFKYKKPKKSGGFINKKERPLIRHSYCPFCGLHVTTGEPAIGEEQTVRTNAISETKATG
ncbi:hypothetical protein LMG33810_001205 [Carnimonas sp. LMG 33810]